jgi:hypothetical protein
LQEAKFVPAAPIVIASQGDDAATIYLHFPAGPTKESCDDGNGSASAGSFREDIMDFSFEVAGRAINR